VKTGVCEIPSSCAKVTHMVKIKVTGYYYNWHILYNDGLSKHVARHTVTDLEWQALTRIWDGGPWGGTRMVNLMWRWRINSGEHVVADRGADLPIKRT